MQLITRTRTIRSVPGRDLNPKPDVVDHHLEWSRDQDLTNQKNQTSLEETSMGVKSERPQRTTYHAVQNKACLLTHQKPCSDNITCPQVETIITGVTIVKIKDNSHYQNGQLLPVTTKKDIINNALQTTVKYTVWWIYIAAFVRACKNSPFSP